MFLTIASGVCAVVALLLVHAIKRMDERENECLQTTLARRGASDPRICSERWPNADPRAWCESCRRKAGVR